MFLRYFSHTNFDLQHEPRVGGGYMNLKTLIYAEVITLENNLWILFFSLFLFSDPLIYPLHSKYTQQP